MKKFILLFGSLFLLVSFLLVARNFQNQKPQTTQKEFNLSPLSKPGVSEELPVAVEVEFLKDKSSTTNLVFKIILDTHSVDLLNYDFQKDVVLTDRNGKGYLPSKTELSGAGHHREAEIEFAEVASGRATVVVGNLFGQPDQKFEFER